MVKRNFFIQTGRVAVVNYGDYAGKYVTILDVVDSNRVLVDGPTSGVPRQTIPIRWLGLTNIRFRVPRTIKSSTLKKVMVKNEIDKKAETNNWVKKTKKQKVRANLTDFERFQVYLLKKQRATILKQ